MREASVQLQIEPASPAGAFERRLNDLHEMLYRRGGIRPVNAAIEELSKVLLLQLQHARHPEWQVKGHGSITEVLDPMRVRGSGDTSGPKEAFRQLLMLPEYAGRLPDGGLQPIWPLDEPLRIERTDILAEALEVMAPTTVEASTLTGYDMLGTAFDVFLRGRYDHAGGLATYLTPHNVASMLAQLAIADDDLLAEDIRGPIIGDPCCGTGRFLIAAIHEVVGREADEDQARAARLRALLEQGLFGADQSASSVAKARINLLLFGVDHPYVFTVQDSITDAHIDALRGKLRVILTNPPFGEGKYDSPPGVERTRAILPSMRQRSKIDPALAFTARCLDLLADGGHLGIVLPDGLIDSKTLKDALLRHGETRLADTSVVANVSLPTATFAMSGTVAKTSTVVIRKGGASRSSIFLARAEHVGYVKQGGSAALDPAGDDLPVIAAAGVRALTRKAWAEASEPVVFLTENPLAAVVRSEDLQTLDPSRLDPAAFAAREVLREEGGFQLREIIQPVRRRTSRADGETPFVSVLHVDDLGVIEWHKAYTYSPSTPGQRAKPGELLFSLLNPRQMRAAVIPESVGEVLCSAEFGIFESQIDPYSVLALLHDPRVRAQLAPLGRGTSSSRRRIEEEDLLETYAPRILEATLAEIGHRLREAMEKLTAATSAVAATFETVTLESS